MAAIVIAASVCYWPLTYGQSSSREFFSARSLDNPAPPASTTPNLTSDGAGRVYLSWVEHTRQGDRFQFARLDGTDWSPVQTIASGDNWFVNWADVSSLAVDEHGPVAAHFLRRSGDDTYAYDAVLTTPDGDDRWRPAEPLHLDRSLTEHGFVSLVPLADGEIFATWLDGRNFATGADGPMTLRVRPLRPRRRGAGPRRTRRQHVRVLPDRRRPDRRRRPRRLPRSDRGRDPRYLRRPRR